ncbi:MAG: serine--tRNA ligase [Candidatus Roizmanbacteria bacterium]
MLSIDFIRENPELVKKGALSKKKEVDIDEILRLDAQKRKLQTELQILQAERNENAKSSKGAKPSPEEIQHGKDLKEKIQKIEADLNVVTIAFDDLMLQVPNYPYPESPEGGEEANQEIKTWGEIPSFSFSPKSHIELIESLDLADLERGSKVSGFRGYFLKNELALLQMGIIMYVMQKLMAKGYTPLIAPALVKEFTLFGNGQLPWGRQEVYHLQDDDLYLAGTAEVPVTAYYANEILDEKDLPKKFVALSPCFRREIGNYGKDTKGLYRVHEFWKIEQLILCKNDHEESKKMHAELEANTEEIWQDLKIPYRVLLMAAGDMGEPQHFKYDVEAWMPHRNGYGEVGSNSIIGDFQARRLNIKYKKKDGTKEYVHTLNNTAVPFPRALVAILENYQQEDGSIKVPEVLVPFVGFDTIKLKT